VDRDLVARQVCGVDDRPHFLKSGQCAQKVIKLKPPLFHSTILFILFIPKFFFRQLFFPCLFIA
jgi:hypothetical protein